MNTLKLKTSFSLVALLVLSPAILADEGPAETGPAKAAKETASFVDVLDRDTFLGGKFNT